MEEIVKIATLENEIEAKLLDAVLTEQNVPHFIGTYHDAAYNGIFQPQKGWGFVEAPASYEKHILEILTDIRKSDGFET